MKIARCWFFFRESTIWCYYVVNFLSNLHNMQAVGDPWAVLSLEILVASDFDKVVRTAIYYLQYYYM